VRRGGCSCIGVVLPTIEQTISINQYVKIQNNLEVTTFTAKLLQICH
jgi:hypothetical protein